MQEPLQTFFGPTGRHESIGVRIEQPCRRGTTAVRVEVGGLQGHHGLVVLAEIHAGTSEHDTQFCGVVAGQCACFVAASELEGLLRTSESAFAVGHHGEQAGTAGHPAGCTKLRQSLRPFTGVVGGDAGGLADHCDAAGALACGTGMSERGARVVVEQAACHHQMTCHRVRVRLVQTQQVAADGRIEFGRFDVIGQIRFVRAGFATLRRHTLTSTTGAETTLAAATPGCAVATTVAALGTTTVSVGGAAAVAATAVLTTTPVVATPSVVTTALSRGTRRTLITIAVAAVTARTVGALPGTVTELPAAIVVTAGTFTAGALAVRALVPASARVVAAAIASVSARCGTTISTSIRSTVIALRGTTIIAAAGRTSAAGAVRTLPAVVAPTLTTLAGVAVAGRALVAGVVGAFVALVLAARPRSGSSTPEGPTFTVAVGHRKILS